MVGLAITGCGAPSVDNPADLDVVVTIPNNGSFDFKQARTYALPTTIPLIKTSNAEAEPVEEALNADLQAVILDTTKQQMSALGYRLIPAEDTEEKPDVFLEISALATTQVDVYYSSWYSTWGAYYAPWYGGTIGVGWAPYAVPYITTSQYGSVIMNMTNPNAPDPTTQTIPTLWAASVAGLIANQTVTQTAKDRIVNGINQAFAQSPYLNNGT
jgi:hypothetical protein